MSKPFSWPIRIYYEDTDAAGIVYHARYLHFAERARTELLRQIGFDHQTLRADHDLVFAVQRCETHFRKPALLDDALKVQSHIGQQSGARIEFVQQIVRGSDLICHIKITLAVLSSNMRPKRLPQILKDAFRGHTME